MKTKKLFLTVLVILLVAAPLCVMATGKGEGAKTGTVKFWHGYPEYDVVLTWSLRIWRPRTSWRQTLA
jgi:hypothetical protein